MGGSKRQKKSTSVFSMLSIFKSRRNHRVEDARDDAITATKVWSRDDDRRHWKAEPGIDRKASAFIAKFHATRVSESELQTIPRYQAEKA